MRSASPTSPPYDVVVVGARCAGAATAMLLARAGHDVALVDRATFPSDTLSTHAIARGGVVQLTRWGLLDAVLASGAPPIRDIAFHDGAEVVTRRLKSRHGVDVLVAPRRTVLDHILVDAAEVAGADVRTGVTVTGVTRADDGRVTGVRGRTAGGAPVEVRARLVVGADGLRSRIARSVGAPVVLAGPDGGSVHYAYFAGDWPAMEYHLGERAFAGVFPTHGGEACVWVCVPAPVGVDARRRHATVDDAFRDLVHTTPSLPGRLARARQTTAARGAVGLPNQFRAATGPGWALVGDAAYHRDPITGYGISDAFRDADLLAAALDEVLTGADEPAALRRYEREQADMARPIFDLTCAMATFPPAGRFRELQIGLSDAIEAEAAVLAGRGAVVGSTAA